MYYRVIVGVYLLQVHKFESQKKKKTCTQFSALVSVATKLMQSLNLLSSLLGTYKTRTLSHIVKASPMVSGVSLSSPLEVSCS